jgi:exodeoxyribonuclease III
VKVITCNVNGIRSASKKGFFTWVKKQQADFICLQETRAQLDHLEYDGLLIDGYHRFHADAKKPGYSGVAIYTPHQPLKSQVHLGWKCVDDEGRFLQLDYPKFSIISLYLPSGTSGDHRQAEKYDFLDKFTSLLVKFIQSQHPFIICGDWNIAHRNIDLKNWRANQNHSGFLPAERAWLDKVFDNIGWVDAFRVVNQQADQYTWWSNRGQAWVKNVGWRIDYQVVTPNIAKKIQKASIYKSERFSDHAPLIIEYQHLSIS